MGMDGTTQEPREVTLQELSRIMLLEDFSIGGRYEFGGVVWKVDPFPLPAKVTAWHRRQVQTFDPRRFVAAHFVRVGPDERCKCDECTTERAVAAKAVRCPDPMPAASMDPPGSSSFILPGSATERRLLAAQMLPRLLIRHPDEHDALREALRLADAIVAADAAAPPTP